MQLAQRLQDLRHQLQQNEGPSTEPLSFLFFLGLIGATFLI